MRLRNKKTGEVKDWCFPEWLKHITNPNNEQYWECSISEFIDRVNKFRDEWEDIQEDLDLLFNEDEEVENE